MFLCIKTDIFVASSLIQIKLTYAGKMLRQIAEKLKIVKKCQLICLLQPMNHNLESQPRRIEFIFFSNRLAQQVKVRTFLQPCQMISNFLIVVFVTIK